MENIIYYGVISMNEKNPRWLNEIPKPITNNTKRELTEKEKKEANEFEKAVNSGKIEQWFNEK
jgi:hypothetical protein